MQIQWYSLGSTAKEDGWMIGNKVEGVSHQRVRFPQVLLVIFIAALDAEFEISEYLEKPDRCWEVVLGHVVN